MMPRSVKLYSDSTDWKRGLADPKGLESFYRKWLATHLELNWFIEIGHSGPGHRGFTRNLFHLPETGAGLVLDLRRERNLMVSTARYPEPIADKAQARYPILTLDFDCKENPWRALREALRIAKAMKRDYGVDSVLVRSGFKGAHLHIPLKRSASHEELVIIGKSLIRIFEPRDCNGTQIIDSTSFEDYRHLIRIPYTFNIHGEGRRLAVILDLKLNKVEPRDFEWGDPLDPRDLGLAIVEINIPSIHRSKPGKRARGWDWIEKVLENGLPDGRKRFILWVASRYLVNVKGLGLEEALGELEGFLEASCRNHGNCSRIYSSWLRSVLRGVAAGGYKPPSLRRLKEKHPDLYKVITGAIGGGNEPERLGEPLPEPFHSFLEDTGLTVFSYEDVKQWLEARKGRVSSGEWSRVTRQLRKLAEEGLLGRMYLVDGEWLDYGPGPVEKPPSRIVRFYAVR